MLPHISAEENIPPVARKVYINPNFHSQMANGSLQLQGRVNNNNNRTLQSWDRPAIHINPYFLQRQQEYQLQQLQQQQQQQQLQPVTYYEQTVAVNNLTPPPAKIISKASTCLVRKPPSRTTPTPKATPTATSAATHTTFVKSVPNKSVLTMCIQAPLVSLSKRKLIRQGASAVKPATATVTAPTKRTKYKLVRAISLTSSSSTPLVKKRRTREFVARYALRRTNDAVAGKKLSLKSPIMKPSVNKSLSMVSIHGVMYKKTAKNKLTKLDANSRIAAKSAVQQGNQVTTTTNSTGRTLFVRGTKFVLDPSGCRLTRVPLNTTQLNPSLRLRIDIGGLTYVSSAKTQNVFIRTTNHVSRAHLMTAKQRSLQLLNRSLVKTNVPCAIFQRLGKCAAHSRGKCRRLHDKRQVAICPSFLRGECTKINCLLSHNVTLEKMPVCRYFLRGICVREDCPYLHKKLSHKAEICIDFLRGYCARAADCNMRHEFVCPEFARRGKCEQPNCSYCKQMNQHKLMLSKGKAKAKERTKVSTVAKDPKAEVTPSSSSRYFKCESDKLEILPAEQPDEELAAEVMDAEEDEPAAGSSSNPRRRVKLGTLPAFIPLGGSSED